MNRFRVLCLAVATLELMVVVVVLWSSVFLKPKEKAAAELSGSHSEQPAKLLYDEMTEEKLELQEEDSENAQESLKRQEEDSETAIESPELKNNDNEAEPSEPIQMRVMLKTSDYSSYEHEVVVVSCTDTFHLIGNGKEQIFTGGQSMTLTLLHPFFQEGPIRIISEGEPIRIESILHRGEVHNYKGILELYPGQTGIILVNQLSLEDYVARVVSSEMPASYGVQAAMLQAVCARTFAYERILHQKTIGPYGAYADDSTDFQVYNSAGEKENSEQGTKLTEGIIMTKETQPIIPYYFSTSCGYTARPSGNTLSYLNSLDLTGTGNVCSGEEAYAAFFQDWNAPAVEAGMCWYRWRCEISAQELELLLAVRIRRIYQENSQMVRLDGGSLDALLGTGFLDITASVREAGGIVTELTAVYQGGTIAVCGEMNVRRLLGAPDRTYANLSQSGKTLSEGEYLPSAFFCIVPEEDPSGGRRYVIHGGGNGHGIGLSQNAAYRMLESGLEWKQVLEFFYQGIAFSTIK